MEYLISSLLQFHYLQRPVFFLPCSTKQILRRSTSFWNWKNAKELHEEKNEVQLLCGEICLFIYGYFKLLTLQEENSLL